MPADFSIRNNYAALGNMSSAQNKFTNLAWAERPPEVKPIEINSISVLQKAHVSTNRALHSVYS